MSAAVAAVTTKVCVFPWFFAFFFLACEMPLESRYYKLLMKSAGNIWLSGYAGLERSFSGVLGYGYKTYLSVLRLVGKMF